MSVGIGMCIFSQMYLINLFKLCFLLYFIYVITRQPMVPVWMITPFGLTVGRGKT